MTAIRPCMCPLCGYLMDYASPPAGPDKTPKSGDLTMCLSCGAVLVFTELTDGLGVQLISEKEWQELGSANQALLERIGRARRKVIPPEGLVRTAGKA